jgi:hypothetical protein
VDPDQYGARRDDGFERVDQHAHVRRPRGAGDAALLFVDIGERRLERQLLYQRRGAHRPQLRQGLCRQTAGRKFVKQLQQLGIDEVSGTGHGAL